MESIPLPEELEVLWRLAGRRSPGEHAARLNSRFEDLRPRILAIMLEMILMELEREEPAVQPTREEIAVLLASTDSRIRLLGVRLLAFGGGHAVSAGVRHDGEPPP